MNPLYQSMMQPQQPQQTGQGGFMQQFMEFRKNFTGDPQQRVQQMLASGQITQAQYDRAVQMANQLYGQLKV